MALFNKFDTKRGGSESPELDAIIENLNNILNTKKGFGSSLPDFGIRDMNEYTSREHISQAVIEEVRYNIEKYEPRLELVNIEVGEDGGLFNLSFRIDCIVRQNKETLKMIFDSVSNNFRIKDKK